MQHIDLPYGDGVLSFAIDEDPPVSVIRPRKVSLPPDAAAVVRDALAEPIGSPPLEALLRTEHTVALIVDDITRQTPAHLIMPPVLKLLHAAGVPRKAVRIVMALGTHRPLTDEEIRQKVGAAVAGAYFVSNTSCRKPEESVYLGHSAAGIPAWVHREVVAADVRIGIGMITPHMDAGFSGGGKIILPGVCGKATVEAFHRRQAEIAGNQLGRPDAPLRRDLEAFVAERIGLDFIVNAVLDSRGRLYRCVAGHFVEAHRRGVAFALEVYGATAPGRYPVVVANAYPAQIDLWQSTKALAAGELMTADGGTLILVAQCPEGNATHPLVAEYIGREPASLVQVLDTGRAEDPVACALAVPLSRIRQRAHLTLVSSGLTPDVADRMGAAFYTTVDEAIAAARERQGPEAAVGVLTHGGVTLPLVSG
jgi:nickel-dependent lactate racemase